MARRILVVDDEKSFTTMLKIVLEDTGDFEVHEVNLPHEAVATAQRVSPDVVILDVLMPEMSGLEVAGQFRRHPKLSALPIIFLSAAMSREATFFEEDALRNCPVLTKPTGSEEIIQCIEALIGPDGQTTVKP